jgi:hypothetical protein
VKSAIDMDKVGFRRYHPDLILLVGNVMRLNTSVLHIILALYGTKLFLLYFLHFRSLCNCKAVMNWRCISGDYAARKMYGMSGVSQNPFLFLYIIQMAGHTPLVCDSRSNMYVSLKKIMVLAL